MSKRASDLLQEMQGIFGGVFGSASSLTESADISEARRAMPGKNADKRMAFGKKGGHAPPDRKEKTGLSFKKRKEMKAASAKQKEQDAEGSKRFHDVMKDIHAEVDKSHKKHLEKKAAKDAKGGSSRAGAGGGGGAGKASGGGGGGGGRHNPFKRSSSLPATDMKFHYVEPEEIRPHHETKCWNCKCGNIYTAGCKCVASGNGAKCPDKGTIKHIHVDKGYRKRYNDAYHKWRGAQGGGVTRRLGGR